MLKATHERVTNIFLRYGLPGMTLKAPCPPLVKRCGFGRQISGAGLRCIAWQHEVLSKGERTRWLRPTSHSVDFHRYPAIVDNL